jgi:hypothetical protein
MRTMRELAALSFVAVAVLAGCDKNADPPAPAAPAQPVPSQPAPKEVTTDRWVGQWNGPEGTYLRLSGGEGKYDVAIRNLDGERGFKGEAAGDRIRFQRDGVEESIRATDGKETGMKWLADKKDCLSIKTGEGYCRD